MSAIIALILANLPTILKAGKAGYDFIMSVRKAAQQSGEWTEENEASFQAQLSAEAIDPAWLPDAPVHDATPELPLAQAAA